MNRKAGGYRVLVVDDEPEVLNFVEEVLGSKGYFCDTSLSSRNALTKLRKNSYHLLITDVRLPDGSGIDVIRVARERHPYMAAIVITGYASVEGIKEALALGATEYIPKPFSAEELLLAVEKTIKKQGIRKRSSSKSLIVNSPAMQEVMALVKKVGVTDSTVLISGESGTGKEMIARALHRMSQRSSAPFVSVNSGGIPEGLLESELFGHSKGAYTGAHSTTIGHFQAAEGGTLFLDEIGNMGQPMQIKLLRALQEREITPVGSVTPTPVNVRLISATNSNLALNVKNGSFRQDLYYRINVIEIKIPPLRERPTDIVPLAEHFIKSMGFQGKDVALDDSAVLALLAYQWPGNVRELGNVIERAMILAEGNVISASHLPDWIRGSVPETVFEKGEIPLKTVLNSVERHYIEEALAKTGWVRSKAAARLGLKRTTLLARMKKLNISP